LELSNISKIYDKAVVAVKDFNLRVADKEFVVFVGPSGCGKSTTLRMIAGLEEITRGELFIDGKKMNEVPPAGRDIAMVFQSYALYPHMTVYDNIAFGLHLRKIPKPEIQRKVMEVSKTLELEALLERKPKALSGGQKQRVAMGRAIVREPKVFLMDEPLSNLDAKLRVQMRTEIAKLHRRLQTTFVYVTHDQTEAMTLGDRIVVMQDGAIMQADTPENLYDRPANLFVAGFIGTPAMRFVDVEIQGGLVKWGGCEMAVPRLDMGKTAAVLGVRSENVHIGPGPGANYAAVDNIETQGADSFVSLSCGGQSLLARMESSKAKGLPGQVPFYMDVDKIHLFDRENGGKGLRI
jgi:multiple sugar transport system ATP-binding protein